MIILYVNPVQVLVNLVQEVLPVQPVKEQTDQPQIVPAMPDSIVMTVQK